MRGINEECGVFGIWNHPEASHVTYFGLHSLQHRGQEGAGIVAGSSQGLDNHRGHGLVSEVFRDDSILDRLSGDRAIGHVRYSTSGSNHIENVQPFLFHFYDMDLGICHNGNLVNARALRKRLEERGAIFHSSSDTEVLVHLIRHSQAETFEGKLQEGLNQLRGGFTYLIVTKDALYGAVDQHALRPLVIGKMKNGAYVAASETCAIDVVGAEFVCNIMAGQYVVINDQGIRIEAYAAPQAPAVTAMEYVYFARPDSVIAGQNVHATRKRAGRRLAQEAPAQADMVIGVPNSSLSAATGYAEVSGLPYEMGLIKNQYVARTFIQPTQELREQGVRMKLSAVKSIVGGKRVVMVDDSIVRGTTSRRIVQLLKEAGAKEVHVRIAAPPILFPSFYGIDMSTSGELICANHSLEEVCELINADSLAFLSDEGLKDAIGLEAEGPNKGLCMDCFSADYVAGLHDYEQQFYDSLTPIQQAYLAKKEAQHE